MAKIICAVKLNTFDTNHKLKKSQIQPMRSWTRHLFDMFYIELGRTNTLAAINDVSGAARNHVANSGKDSAPYLIVGSAPGGVRHMVFPAGSTDEAAYWNGTNYNFGPMGDDFGIQVGSDNTAATPTDDALGTKIAHGEAAGELLYGGTEIFGLTFANPNGEFTIRRYFTNISGGNVTVEECGIYSLGMDTVTVCYAFCIARDVVAPAVVVADTEILEVTYTVQITV